MRGAACLQLLFLAALLHLVIKLYITKLVPLRHLHVEYYTVGFSLMPLNLLVG